MELFLNLLPSPKHPLLAGPGLHLRWRWGWLKGWLYRIRWAFFSPFGGARVKVGARLSIQGSLRLVGRGQIEIGEDCLFDGKTDLFTHESNAILKIGKACFLNGARIAASRQIEVGDRCILADVRIMDTDFHSLGKDRMNKKSRIETAPIFIGENVWIAASAGILKGVRIGRDSVIGFGSVVTGEIPPGSIAAGNPARVVGSVPERTI